MPTGRENQVLIPQWERPDGIAKTMKRLSGVMSPKRPGWQVGAALLFIAAGFVVIGVAWNGAASIDFAQGQLPYLLSGGAAGLGLIGVGMVLILFEGSRRSRVHLDRRLDTIAGLLEETMRARGEGANGNGSHAQKGLVVAGKSSFHLPTCRLVIGKEDQVLMTSEEALERGLTPCRLCSPVVLADEPASRTEH
jgi:hypothetical protein